MKQFKNEVAIIRGIMRASGARFIWNNPYKTMRSVKCWSRSDETGVALAARISRVLKDLNVKHNVKFNYLDNGYSPPSLIIQLPY